MIKRRFIAGAVCPACKKIDKIVMIKDGESNRRECVACDFKEELTEQSVQKEINQLENPVQVVNIKSQD